MARDRQTPALTPVDQPRPVSREAVERARDRVRVEKARHGGRNHLMLVWLLVGPGILAMLGENDGSSMLSYAQTGAQFGLGFFLPFIACLFVMAYIVQEQTLRVGAATGRGHAAMIFERFGPFWGWFSLGDLALGNFLTLVTEFIAVRAGLGYFGVPPAMAVGLAVLILLLATSTARYWTWERLVLGLAFVNLVFVPVALLSHPHWGAVASSFITWRPLAGGFTGNTILLLLSDIGATVTPWMLFFQQSATVDKGLNTADVRHGRIDTFLGAVLAGVVAVAAVVATASLHTKGINVHSFQGGDFARALEPVVGHVGAIMFALGMVEAGVVAAITISTSTGYAFSEAVGRGGSLNQSIRESLPFYGALVVGAIAAAGLVLIPGAPLVLIVLFVNVVAVLAMPPALVLLYLLVNDQDVMGPLRNTARGNAAATLIVCFLVAAGTLYGVSVTFPGLFGPR